jgi:FtsP/CotA-like multicopper oxidase with cupredoxin domain
MRDLTRRAGASVEAGAILLAAVLAFGTLSYMEALHAFLLGTAAEADGAHFLRDGLLAMAPALAAAVWGLRSPRRVSAAAARIAVAFSALLIPATAAHQALHGADDAAVAHAAGHGSGRAAGTGAEQADGLLGSLLHGAGDAMLALPVAFVLSLGVLWLLLGRRERAFRPIESRRLLVLAISALVMAGAAAIVPVTSAVSPDYPKFAQPLSIPPVLTAQDIHIDIAETQQQILPGEKTTMWTYNGTFPGPIIRRPTGVPTNVTFTNNLPPSAGSLSVHHHGTQAPEQDDGQPASYLIAPGASRTYSYPGIDNSAPERAAPQWYHDHRDMVTGRNVWMGLVGAFIYDDAFEQSLDLPQGPYDVPLLVTDREFDADNQIPYSFVAGGVFGDVILVNGVPQPFFDVGDRRYRLRLYNVSNRREYTFQLSNGQAMTQIGTDSGLLPAPVSRTAIRLGPAERADVVVDFAGHLGEDIVLQNGDAALGPGDRDGEVMQFRVDKDLSDDSSPVPSTLRPVFQTDVPVRTRTWNFDRTGGEWTINGKGFDPGRVDAEPVLGTTERWIFNNPTTLPHIAHVHLGDQKLVSRHGQPPPPYERVKESWYLAPGDQVVVDIKFTDHIGTFVFHCHVLEHEDHAMMSQFRTIAPGTPPPPSPPAPPAPVPLPFQTLPGTSAPAKSRPLSRRIRILSTKRRRHVVALGVRYESAVPVSGSTLRAQLRVGGRRLGSLRRTGLARGRVQLRLRLSRDGRARLTRVFKTRRRVQAQLRVSAGGETRSARFSIWR